MRFEKEEDIISYLCNGVSALYTSDGTRIMLDEFNTLCMKINGAVIPIIFESGVIYFNTIPKYKLPYNK